MAGFALAPDATFVNLNGRELGTLDVDDCVDLFEMREFVKSRLETGTEFALLFGEQSLHGPEIVQLPLTENYTITVVTFKNKADAIKAKCMTALDSNLHLVHIQSHAWHTEHSVAFRITLDSPQGKQCLRRLEQGSYPNFDTQGLINKDTNRVYFFLLNEILEFSVSPVIDSELNTYGYDYPVQRRIQDLLTRTPGSAKLNRETIELLLSLYEPLNNLDKTEVTYMGSYATLDALRKSIASQAKQTVCQVIASDVT